MNSYTPHVWRVRVWIRLLALGNALIWGSLGAAVLFEVMPMGEDPVRGWVLLATLLVIPLYFAWHPYLVLTADGRLRIRGWFRSRTSDASHVTSMYMNSYGLCFEFVDAKPFTCVVFQATAYRTYPRFFDAVEAITGTRPTLDGYTPFNLGPQLRPETMPTSPRFDNGPVKYLADIVSKNRDWVIAGEYRRALDRMSGLLREHPLDLELRAATAQLYRELGNPDEAGRWGFIVPGGATDGERDRFIKRVRMPGSPGARALLLLPPDFPLELEEVPDSRASLLPIAWSSKKHFAQQFGQAGAVAAVVSLAATVLLVVGVYSATAFGESVTAFARVAGGFVTVGFGLALLFGGLSAATGSRPKRAAAFLFLGAVIIFWGAVLVGIGNS